MAARRQVLGDVVTAYEVSPGEDASALADLAKADEATAQEIYERLLDESAKLASRVKP